MKLQLFRFIDEVVDYKESLRFEITQAKKAMDSAFLTLFQKKDNFINYTSRIKENSSLAEKIIRQNFAKRFSTPEGMFDCLSDIIGCRIECRFMSDEEDMYQELFHYFKKTNGGDYYRCQIDPRIELNLSDSQPKSQKNKVHSYRIDGRFLGEPVLNFELQIKSIVSVFWNEIDHKILYKNYNYVLTEDFVREMMTSIYNDLNVIDKQLEMVYRHLLSLDQKTSSTLEKNIQDVLGRLIQDSYVYPIREQTGIILDFRTAIDLITEFLAAKVRFESREEFGAKFMSYLDRVTKTKDEPFYFGEMIDFDPPVEYKNHITAKLGQRLMDIMNIDIIWNLLIHIILDLDPDPVPQDGFRTFIDYLYFRIIHTVRQSLVIYGVDPAKEDKFVDAVVDVILKDILNDPEPKDFTNEGLKDLEKVLLETYRSFDCWDAASCLEDIRAAYPRRTPLGYLEKEDE